MRRVQSVLSPLAALSMAAAFFTAGCSGSSALTGPDEAALASGAAVIQGTVAGGGVTASSTGVRALSDSSGLTVSVVGTASACPVDEEGHFTLAGVPAGQVTLRFEGPGVAAELTLSGLLDGQILSIEVHVAGASAQLTAPASTTSETHTKFKGTIDSIHGQRLVVSSRHVDGSTAKKVWRGDVRIELGDLRLGEKVTVWGTLKGDGILYAHEIEAEGPTTKPAPESDGFVSFRGTVESVGASAVHSSPNGGGSPSFIVKGTKVRTDGGTKFKWSDGTALDPHQVRTGDKAYVEGWRKPDGSVLATRMVVDCR